MTDESKRQIDKFREAARQLETDDREEAFDAMVKKISKAPAKSNPAQPDTTKSKTPSRKP